MEVRTQFKNKDETSQIKRVVVTKEENNIRFNLGEVDFELNPLELYGLIGLLFAEKLVRKV